MAEEKLPKSWGNGYFRFTIMDILKMLSFILGIYLMYDRIDDAILTGVLERAEIRSRLLQIENRLDAIEDYHDRNGIVIPKRSK